MVATDIAAGGGGGGGRRILTGASPPVLLPPRFDTDSNPLPMEGLDIYSCVSNNRVMVLLTHPRIALGRAALNSYFPQNQR